MEFIPLCCGISILPNVLPSNINTLHCLYQSCYTFQSFLHTNTRHINTYLKHTSMCKLNIITLQAHKYYYLAIILYFFSISLFIVILTLFSMVCHILPHSLPASKSVWYNSWFNCTLFSMVCHILPHSLPASKSVWYNSWFNCTLFL